jgi:hypothetical protein
LFDQRVGSPHTTEDSDGACAEFRAELVDHRRRQTGNHIVTWQIAH